MKYLGGKFKIRKQVAEKIAKTYSSDRNVLISLFCGSCPIEEELTDIFDRVICNDANEYLIAMFEAIQNGWEMPKEVTYEMWDYARKHLDEEKAFTAYVGFGCSFGGRFFEGYARDKSGKRNYAMDMYNSLTREIDKIKKIEYQCNDYKNVIIPQGGVVYADPPYNGTTKYHNKYSKLSKFDSNEFWEYMREISKNNIVFISEQNAPNDFMSVWEKGIRRNLCKDVDKRVEAKECLYIHKDWLDFYNSL